MRHMEQSLRYMTPFTLALKQWVPGITRCSNRDVLLGLYTLMEVGRPSM